MLITDCDPTYLPRGKAYGAKDQYGFGEDT